MRAFAPAQTPLLRCVAHACPAGAPRRCAPPHALRPRDGRAACISAAVAASCAGRARPRRPHRCRASAAAAAPPPPPAPAAAAAAGVAPPATPPPVTPPPALRDLLAFTLPSMGIWLASPLLSIVDVSVVGLSSTAELAALAPATALTDSSMYCFTFLAVATTSLISRAHARGDTPAAQAALREALGIAAACGLALGAVLLLGAEPLLGAYAGGASEAVLRPAVAYTRIRALGAPFGVVTSVAQAAFLAAKAPRMPLLTVALASVVNLAGDVVLCVGLRQGAAGAAWATVASQVAAAAVILSRLRAPPLPGAPPLLGGEWAAVPWLPRRAACARMLRIGGPVALLILLKILLISGGITGAAARLSATASAVHAVMMTLLIFSGTFGDAVSAAAQSFLPALLGRPAAAFALARLLLATATVVGLANCACAGLIPVFAPGLFTTSAEVAAGMRQLAPVMCAALVLHCASMATEGLLLAGRDLRWLLGSYARNAAACFLTLTLVIRWGWGLPGVWLVFTQFHVTRLAQNGHRIFLSDASPLKSTATLQPDDA